MKPTPESERARFASKMLEGECKEGVFQIAIKIAEFATIAVRPREMMMLKACINKCDR